MKFTGTWIHLIIIILSVTSLMTGTGLRAQTLDAPWTVPEVSPETSGMSPWTSIDPDLPIFPENTQFQCPKKEKICRGVYPERGPQSSKMALLTNGEASLAARIRTLREARHSIRIEALEFKGDETGFYIGAILKAKKAQGLDVRMIVDGFSNFASSSKVLYVDLMKSGIPVEGAVRGYPGWLDWFYDTSPFHPTHINMRFHEKMWVIDGEDPDHGVAILGGMNVANGYMRIGEKPFRDQDLIVRGAIVKDVADAFDSNFQEHVKMRRRYPRLVRDAVKEIGQLSDAISNKFFNVTFPHDSEKLATLAAADPLMNPQAPPLPAMVPTRLRLFQNRPRHGERLIRQAYVDLIQETALEDPKEILIENAYFVPTESIKRALISALKLGAKITILTNSLQTTDYPSLVFVSRWNYKKLLALNNDPQVRANGGKIQIWEWKGKGEGFDEGLLHSKFAVFNRRRALVGSYNLDPRSEHFNSEDAMTFENPVLAEALARQFLEGDLSKSTRITMSQAIQFRRMRSLVQKSISWILRHIESPLF